MFEKKFNWKIWFFILLFCGIVLMASYVVLLLATNNVVDENDKPLSALEIGFMCFMLCLVCSTYVATVIALLKQVISHKNIAFRIEEDGIHSTVVLVYLFAFVIVSGVDFIPWSAVRYMDGEEDGVYIRVDKKQIYASRMGKLIIGFSGYHFCNSFIKKKLSPEEKAIIMSYCMSQLSCLTPDSPLWEERK